MPKKMGKGGTRKHGRGKRKAERSRFHSFAGIIGESEVRKGLRKIARAARLKARREARVCQKCGVKGFSDRRELKRHAKRCGTAARGEQT
jgi:NADH pyrophosphatase NudC (nudix superfamily)